MIARLVAAAAALLLLVGCSHSPDHGVVRSKEHHAAYATNTYIMISCGKTFCMFPQTVYHPECFELILDTGRVCVREEQWDNTETGSVWAKQ